MKLKKVIRREVFLNEDTLSFQTMNEPVYPLTELEIIKLFEAIPADFDYKELVEAVRKVEKAHGIV